MTAGLLPFQAAVHLSGQLNQRVSHLNRIDRPRLPLAQRLWQSLEIARGAGANFSERGRWTHASATLHDQAYQRLASLLVSLDRDNIVGHPPIRTVPAPDLLAPGPCRLARRMLAPRQPCVFLQLVGAIERRNVG